MQKLEERKPTLDEIRIYSLEVLRHSLSNTYYLEKLKINNNDSQIPHDLEGEGNKLSWPVVSGLSIQLRDNSKEFFEMYVLPSIRYHQEHQRHHQRWNKPNGQTTYEDLEAGAIDAILSQTEKSIFRKYRGDPVSLEDLPKILDRFKDDLHQTFIRFIYNGMRKIPKPNLDLVQNIYDFPNIGISNEMYKKTQERIKEALNDFRTRGYDI